MAQFNLSKFQNQRFSNRTGEVKIPDGSGLRKFFEGEGTPCIRVRGLTATELGRTTEAAAKNRDVAALLSKLMGGSPGEKGDALQEMIRPDVPDDVARRLEIVHIGTIEPELNFPDVVRLAENFPIEFYNISNQILALTGLGRLPGKPASSGGIPESGN